MSLVYSINIAIFVMFRESDERIKNLHPTFKAKPLPILQAVAQGGKFYDPKVSSVDGEADLLKQDVKTIPSNRDTYYDPSHPDADWVRFFYLSEH